MWSHCENQGAMFVDLVAVAGTYISLAVNSAA